MNKIIKIFLTILALPAVALADCAANDITCQQLEAMSNDGIAPTPIQEPKKTMQSSKETTDNMDQPAQPKPFKIPSFPYTKPKTKPYTITNTIDKTKPIKTLDQQQKMAEPINIFAPHQQSSMEPEKPTTNTNDQKEQKPFPIPKPSSTGMQYR